MAIEGRRQHVRKDPKERKAELLGTGVKLAQKWGISNVSRTMVADATKTTDGLVSRYFGSTEGLHKAIKAEVKKQGVPVPDDATTEKHRLKLWAQRHPNAGVTSPGPKLPPKKASAKKPAASAKPKAAARKPAVKKVKKVGSAKKAATGAKADAEKAIDTVVPMVSEKPAKAIKKAAAKPVKKPTTPSKPKKAPVVKQVAPELPPLPGSPPANQPAALPGLPPLP